MPVPWLRLLDIAIGVTDLARSRRLREQGEQIEQQQQQQGIEPSRGGVPAGLEARLAGVVVAALKEAFERDTRRLELERANLEVERERAERALRLELRRQAADREIGRLRLLAGVAAFTWLGTTPLALLLRRLNGAAEGSIGPLVAFGGGWLLLLLAFATAFMAQSQVADALGRDDTRLDAGALGGLALWFIVAGLMLVGLAVLLS